MISGVVAVIRRGERFLLIQRAPNIPAGGAWCFPGGAIEDGESAAEAIVREVAEEVGLSGRAVRRVWQWTSDDERLHLDWWLFDVDHFDVTQAPAEVADHGWLTAQEIRRHPNVLPGLKQFIETMPGLT